MKFTINTEKFKEMVSRAIRGSGNNKLIPITSLMAIKVTKGLITLVTTDATNYLYIRENTNVVGDEDFYAVVDADTMYKLVSKMTCEKINLEISKGVLNVTGNGSYKIELPLDEDGEAIKYPDPYFEYMNLEDMRPISRATVQVILETLKSSLSTTLDIPCYTAYYAGDKVVATDTYKIANMDVAMFDEPKLISSQLMDLLSVMTVEKIGFTQLDNTLIFTSDDCVIVGKTMEGLDEFAIEPITELVQTKFDHFCAIPKSALMQTLDRLMLFVGPYDKNEVNLTFTKQGLQISSKEANGIEIISYVASENSIDFTCSIDILMLMQEIKAVKTDLINMYYGDDSALKIVDGNITIIIAFLEDEEV